jgi:CheY-like chemotaxis protein/HPt (histidine-containing phosphotransfer) domain-containing protein
VINDILDFSKIEAGKIDLEAIEFSLRECVEEAMKSFALRAGGKGLELLCDIAHDVPETVIGDSGRLRQILLNLVGNAIKFTAHGEVAAKVEVENGEGKTRTVRFTVSDTGIGIPAEKLDAVFSPFTQADSSTTRKYGGSGLGLTISSRLAKMMGGRIWVESEPGRGTRFYFTARFEVVEKRYGAESEASAAMLRGLKILVVDDNRTNRRILEGTLRHWEARAAGVSGGEAALAELTAADESGDPYRVMLTDMNMPQMDGISLIEELRRRPRMASIAIVMLSSGGGRGDAQRCRKMGVSAYIYKPVRRSDLLAAILAAAGQQKVKEKPADEAVALEAPPPRRGLRILVAEDNRVNQAVATRLLEKLGHSLIIAENGQQVLSLLAQQVFDLVLMDVQMPEMDGISATLHIREGELLTGVHLPIVAMTAHAMKGDMERCLDAGMDGYISKPINAAALQEAIASAVPARHAEAAQISSPEGNENAKVAAGLPWNKEQTLKKLGGDEGLLQEVIQIFLEEAPKHLAELRLAVVDGNAGIIETAAHNLKGELSYLGVAEISQRARELEEMGRNSDLEAAAALFERFEREFSSLLSSMQGTGAAVELTAGAAQVGQ